MHAMLTIFQLTEKKHTEKVKKYSHSGNTETEKKMGRHKKKNAVLFSGEKGETKKDFFHV